MPQTITTASPLCMWGRNHNQTADFDYIDWHKLVELIRKPVDLSRLTPKQAKQQCPFILPSDALRKTKDAVQAHDNYTLLIADIDTGDFSLSDVLAKVTALGVESFAIYSTLSHRATDPEKGYKGRRWRVVIELSESVNTEHWNALQGYLCQRLDGDNCATRNRQIAYAPAIGKAKYEHYIQTGKALDPNDINHSFVGGAIAWDNEQKAQQVETRHDLESAHRQAKEALQGRDYDGEGFTIRHALEHLDTYNEWLMLGATDHGKRRLLSPHSESEIPGIYLLDDGRWVSFHGSDLQAGIGISTKSTKEKVSLACGDAFDVYAFREHGNNHKQALKALADKHDPQGQKQRQQAHMQAKALAEMGKLVNAGDLEAAGKIARLSRAKGWQWQSEIKSLYQTMPGVLGDFAREMESHANVIQPALFIQSSLAVGVAVTARRYTANHTTIRAFLMSVLITSGGKDAPKRICEKAVATLRADVLAAGNYTSDTAIECALNINPVQFAVMDEIGGYLQAVNHKSESHKKTAVNQMVVVWSAANTEFRPKQRGHFGVKEKDRLQKVHKPSLSILGFTQPERLKESITQDMIDSGFLPRWLALPGDEDAEYFPCVEPWTNTAPLVAWCDLLTFRHGDEGNQSRVSNGVGNLECLDPLGEPFQINIPFTPEARQRFEAICIENRAVAVSLGKAGDGSQAAVINKLPENLTVIACVIQLSADPKANAIGVECLEWAYRYVLLCADYMRSVVRGMVQSEYQDTADRVCDYISKFGKDGVTRTQLGSDCAPYKKLQGPQKKQLLDDLLEHCRIYLCEKRLVSAEFYEDDSSLAGGGENEKTDKTDKNG